MTQAFVARIPRSARLLAFMIGCLCLSAPALAAMGTVRSYDDSKGFGFVTPDDGGEDTFVHHAHLLNARTLCPGQRVSFEVTQGPKGKQTAHVQVVDGSCGDSSAASAPTPDPGVSDEGSAEAETWDEPDSGDESSGDGSSDEDGSFDEFE